MIIVRIQYDKVTLLAYFDTSDPVCPMKGSSSVQCKGSDGFFDAKFHVNTRQSNGQRDGTGETASRIQVCGKCHGTAVRGSRVATTPASAIARIPASEA